MLKSKLLPLTIALMAILSLFIVWNAAPASADSAQLVTTNLRAGLRASEYGITPWPTPSWWVSSINSMASRFNAVGEQIAIVIEVDGDGTGGCQAHFPNPAPGTNWPNVNSFDQHDLFEADFDRFDARGIKVWLQFEPARCSVPMLIDLVMARYGHHPSIIGFGVDVEWNRVDLNATGQPVTNAQARAWVERARSYNTNFRFFLKHWEIGKMPTSYRSGLVFIDDSQGFPSLNALVNEFDVWGDHFAPYPVGFQFGYNADRPWWRNYSDPPRTIGNALLNRIPNTRDLIWVDFSAYRIWPAS